MSSRPGTRRVGIPRPAAAPGETPDLRGLQRADAAAPEPVDPDWPDPDPDEPIDRGVDGAEHPAQLPLHALAERRPVPGEIGCDGWREKLRQPGDLRGGHPAEVMQV